jgi:hypothetical protein
MEIWKDVLGYEGLYQVSNLGRVKSLEKQRFCKLNNSTSIYKEKIINPDLSTGYARVCIYKNGVKKRICVHQLVAIAFLNHIIGLNKLVVNHINFDKLDNRVENLEIVTIRENSNLKHIKSTSKYVGVFYRKERKSWVARITYGKKTKYLGYFKTELEAHNAYQKELNNSL